MTYTGLRLSEFLLETPPTRMFRSTTRKRNKLPGVKRDHDRDKWVAEGFKGIKSQVRGKTLYYGPDYFEACCARLSWENQNPRQRKPLSPEIQALIQTEPGTCKALAAKYGTSSAMVSLIKRGGWRAVEEAKKKLKERE